MKTERDLKEIDEARNGKKTGVVCETERKRSGENLIGLCRMA